MRGRLLLLAISSAGVLAAGGWLATGQLGSAAEARTADETLGEPDTHRFPLVALASLGRLSWRCDAAGSRFELIFEAWPLAATMELTVSRDDAPPGNRRLVQPRERVLLTRIGLGERARIRIRQATGARTLRADVVVRFARDPGQGYCFAYYPPDVVARLRVISDV